MTARMPNAKFETDDTVRSWGRFKRKRPPRLYRFAHFPSVPPRSPVCASDRVSSCRNMASPDSVISELDYEVNSCMTGDIFFHERREVP
jgi:hypothetical protein